MTNERIIFNEVCTHYDALQRHDLVSRFYTAEQVERYTAGLKFEPDGNGNTPDPVEAAEAFLCSKLFHTWAEWHKEGLTVKKGEKAAITCELWKLSDKKKQPKPDADELTKAAAEQDKGYYYLAKAHLFHRGQVEKPQPRPAGRFKSLDDIRAYAGIQLIHWLFIIRVVSQRHAIVDVALRSFLLKVDVLHLLRRNTQHCGQLILILRLGVSIHVVHSIAGADKPMPIRCRDLAAMAAVLNHRRQC